MLASALVPEKLSAIRSVRYWEVFKYSIYGKRSWYIAHCPLYGRCPLFGVSAKRGSTVVVKIDLSLVSSTDKYTARTELHLYRMTWHDK